MRDRRKPAGMPGSEQRANGDVHDLDDTARERAVELVRRAGRFAREHGDLVSYIFAAVEDETGQGRKTSLQWALERARAHDFPTMEPGRTAINNDYGAPFARVFAREHPDLAPMVQRRPALVDLLTDEEFRRAWEAEIA